MHAHVHTHSLYTNKQCRTFIGTFYMFCINYLYIEFCKHFLVIEIVSEWKHWRRYDKSLES